jgi:hypothetical protein
MFNEEKTLLAIEAVLEKILDAVNDSNALSQLVAAEEIANHQLLQQIAANTNPKPLTRSKSASVLFSGESVMANALVFNVGQTSTASPITYLADGVTPSGATYSAATYTFSDPSATVVLNADGVTATCTAVAASGTPPAPISGSVSFTATDTDGAVSQWVQPFTITTNPSATPPPPSQLSQSSGVTFSTPTP